MHKHFVFIGPQGSGKGTQAAKLSQFLNLPHVATGDMFREAIAGQTEVGKQIKDLMTAGAMVGNDLTNQVVAEAFENNNLDSGYILDGYPRTLPQVEFLEKLSAPDKVIVLSLSDDEAVIRISGRRLCSDCKTMWHIKYLPTKNGESCDECGGKIVQRHDDNEVAVRQRLGLYHAETEPIIEYYEKLGRVISIDGRPDIEHVHLAIKQALI